MKKSEASIIGCDLPHLDGTALNGISMLHSRAGLTSLNRAHLLGATAEFFWN